MSVAFLRHALLCAGFMFDFFAIAISAFFDEWVGKFCRLIFNVRLVTKREKDLVLRCSSLQEDALIRRRQFLKFTDKSFRNS